MSGLRRCVRFVFWHIFVVLDLLGTEIHNVTADSASDSVIICGIDTLQVFDLALGDMIEPQIGHQPLQFGVLFSQLSELAEFA
jgi:hypothetical protein